jgi:UDP-N-acetylglucosamine transferase subunit ALG13
MADAIRHAQIVISHGGPATISEARTAGTIPIVVPRLAAFGEHVDDHQLRYATYLATALEIILAEDADSLPSLARRYPEITSRMPPARRHDPTTGIQAFIELVSRIDSRTSPRT